MKKTRYISLITGSYYTIIFIGIFSTIRGLLLPLIKDYYNINYTSSGLMFLIFLFPGILGNIFNGYIFNKFNKKNILIFGSIILSLFIIAIPFSKNYNIFLFFTFLFGFGATISSTGSNIAIIDTFDYKFPIYKEKAVILLHFSYSFGALATSLFFMIYAKQIIKWQSVYLILAFFSFLLFITRIFSQYPKIEKHNKLKEFNFKKYISIAKNPKMICYFIIAMFYAGSELGITSWIPTYFEKGYLETKEYSSLMLLSFFLFLTIGRFIGSILINKFNKKKLLFILIFLELISIILSFIFRIRIFNFDIFIPLCGLCFSVIYPIIQNYLNEDFKKDISAVTSLFYTGTIIGVTLLTFLIGPFNDLLGEKYGIIITSIYLVLIIPFMTVIIKKRKTV